MWRNRISTRSLVFAMWTLVTGLACPCLSPVPRPLASRLRVSSSQLLPKQPTQKHTNVSRASCHLGAMAQAPSSDVPAGMPFGTGLPQTAPSFELLSSCQDPPLLDAQAAPSWWSLWNSEPNVWFLLLWLGLSVLTSVRAHLRALGSPGNLGAPPASGASPGQNQVPITCLFSGPCRGVRPRQQLVNQCLLGTINCRVNGVRSRSCHCLLTFSYL